MDEAIHSFDPETGEPLWNIEFPLVPVQRPAVAIATPQIVDDHLLISNFYNGSMLVTLLPDRKGAEKVWSSDPEDQKHDDDLNSLMTTPVIRDGKIYCVAGVGEMRCLDLMSGKLIWRNPMAANEDPARQETDYFATCFMVENAGRFFIMNDQGVFMLAKLTSDGYEEIGREKLLEATGFARGRNVVWSHPAFAAGRLFARNDKELICVDLKAK
jgi:outer membrane protein assembly factor BamB